MARGCVRREPGFGLRFRAHGSHRPGRLPTRWYATTASSASINAARPAGRAASIFGANAVTACLAPLPPTLQRDMKAFFGSYTKACGEADTLLFQAGDATAVDEACRRSKVGKLLPDDLYVHRDALDYLEPLLRIYEGCGRAYLGEVEAANLIKIHRRSGKLSYLVYPDFDDDPHPALGQAEFEARERICCSSPATSKDGGCGPTGLPAHRFPSLLCKRRRRDPFDFVTGASAS